MDESKEGEGREIRSRSSIGQWDRDYKLQSLREVRLIPQHSMMHETLPPKINKTWN